MGKVISLLNQKGGVGKTTSAQSLAKALTILEKKVLLMDLDAQGNASYGLGIRVKENTATTYELLTKKEDINDCVISLDIGFDLVPADLRLSAIDMEMASKFARETLLRTAIADLEGYDYIILDCPPSLSLMTINALVASDSVYIPADASAYAVAGLKQLAYSVNEVKQLNPNLDIAGVFLTKVDARMSIGKEAEEYLKEFFGDALMDTKVRVCSKLGMAQLERKDIFSYAPKSRSAEDYMNLAKEVLRNEK